MVHNFFRKNKKKAVISTVVLSLLALSVCVVCIYNSKILAGVFQSHKNEDGTTSYVEKNTIVVLEIVAQDGQQVLGYTVEGSEPIKPEQIEAYTGVIDHDEFLNATGYDVSGTPGNYTVNSSHNNTFNENVLSDMMYSENDRIIVNSVIASSLTEEEMESADLIYINNSADNDENLLYYYDQIVNNGRNGIQKGDKGFTYTGSFGEEVTVKEYAVSKICKAAGNLKYAEDLTVEDFEKAEVENFKDINFNEYITGIAALERKSLDGSNLSDSIANISAALNNINETVKKAAKATVADIVESCVERGSITDEDRENLILALKRRGYDDFYEANEQSYVDKLVSENRTGDGNISGAMKQVNRDKYNEAISVLRQINSGSFNREDLTDEEYLDLISQRIWEVFYNSEDYNKLNSQAYADKFAAETNQYDASDKSAFQNELKNNIISVVNEEEKEKALTALAALAANKAETDNLKNNNIDYAKSLFILSELEEYKGYNTDKYLDAIGGLTDNEALMSLQPGEGGYEMKYSEDKMNALLKTVNDSKQALEISCDILWNVAMKLYEYVTINGRALVYNSELLTGKTIGDYKDPNGENNDNNMYKFLLVLRQMTPDYFRTSVLPKVDSDGNYDDGTGSGLNSKWYAGTFCSAWNNEAAADKNNFCEPAVVGALYDTSGNKIGDTSYIKDNIFSFTGKQFFEGKDFYVDSEDYNKVVGKFPIVKKEYKEEEVTVNAKYDNSKNMFSVEIPSGTEKMYYYLDNRKPFGWTVWDRTYEIDVSDLPGGTIIKIKSPKKETTNNTNFFSVDILQPTTALPTGDKKTIYVDTSAVSYWMERGTGYNYAHCDVVNEIVTTEQIDKTKGEILREIMGISLNQLQSMPFKLLEIQPDANVNEFNSYEGARRLADYLRVDLPDMTPDNYTDYFDIESISIREFDTRHEELNGTYDLIYFGTQTKYMATNEYDDGVVRTTFYNSKIMGKPGVYMDGLVYTGIGPSREVQAFFRGTVADDYTAGSSSGHSKYLYDHKLWTEYFFAEFSGTNALNPNNYYIQKKTPFTTRMMGNDLTVARMDDLLEYVKSGYPILFADGLLNSDEYIDATDTSNFDDAPKWKYIDETSKLYAFIQQAKELGKDTKGQYTDTSAFYDGKPYASLVSIEDAKWGKNPDKLTASEKFKGGLCFAVKRNVQVDFEYIKGPQEYDRDLNGNLLPVRSIGNYVTDSNSCTFVLKPNIARDNVMEWINNNYEFRFTIDKSGTANFPDDQIATLNMQTYFDEKKNEITISTSNGKWPTGLEGFIPWKLEAVSRSNAGNRWTYVGYSAFKKQKSVTVNVLWVKAEAKGNGAYNGTTLDFKNMIDTYDNEDGFDAIPEYDIKVDTIDYSKFVNNWSNSRLSTEEKNNPYDASRSRIKVGRLDNIIDRATDPKDNGKEYDMIVFGYCDSYTGLDINNIYCLNNIDYFVNKANHSMLFAHDNASYITSFNNYVGVNGENSLQADRRNDFARYTTSYLRAMLGMDAYGATYSPLAFDPANIDSDRQYMSWLYKYTPSVYNARSYITENKNPANPTQSELSDMRGYVDGMVLWFSTNMHDWPLYNNRTKIGKNEYDDWVNTKGIECTNKGQIATYPFVIGDSLNIDTETHFQYTRLDIEDKDTTVWYTLSNSGSSPYYDATKGDGSNNYYIYSKGNITYTGAGHRYIKDDATECLLFINTVVAAIKLGNFAPDVTYTESVSVNGSDVLYGYESDNSLKVVFNSTDYDKETGEKNVFDDVQVFLDKNGDGKYNPADGDILLSDNYLHDKDMNLTHINANDIANRGDTTFYLKFTDDDPNATDTLVYLYENVLNQAPKSKMEEVKDLFNENNGYKLVVSVLSKSQKERAERAQAESLSGDVDINDYYQYASARVILRQLHQLR